MSVHPQLAARLNDYQRIGVEWLYRAYHGAHRAGCRGGILGDGMGMGKTVQSITLAHTLLATGQAADAWSLRRGCSSRGT